MKKIILILITLLCIFSVQGIQALAANGNDGLRYYYKGAGAGYSYAGSNGTYVQTNNEWVTVTDDYWYTFPVQSNTAGVNHQVNTK